MTINKAIDLADGMRPNPLDRGRKGQWVIQLEQRLGRELGLGCRELSYPGGGDTKLLAGGGYGQLYVLWLCAQIDWSLKEYEGWNNGAVMFNSMMSDFKKQYLRDNLPQARRARGVWRAEP